MAIAQTIKKSVQPFDSIEKQERGIGVWNQHLLYYQHTMFTILLLVLQNLSLMRRILIGP